jgi:hypothetical protein
MSEPDQGFENGARVPTIDPDIYGDEGTANDGLDLEPVIDVLLLGAKSAREVGERVVCLAYLMDRVTRRPKSYRELALWLECSHVASRARVNRLRHILRTEFAPQLNKTPIVE